MRYSVALEAMLAGFISMMVAAPPPNAPIKTDSPAAFVEVRKYECIGGDGRIEPPVRFRLGRRRFVLEGDRLRQVGGDRDRRLRLGVLSALKDDRPDTLRTARRLARRLLKKRVDALIFNGDLMSHEIDPQQRIVPFLRSLKTIVIAHIGNTESCGIFNQAMLAASDGAPWIINGNWVRELLFDDGFVFTLPGYHDRRFVHSGGGTTYKQADLDWLRLRMKRAPRRRPFVLVAHGPPRMRGRHGIDLVQEGEHVGDPQLNELLQRTKTKFGIFGHILEAGGRGADLKGRRRRPRRWHRQLYVNAGSVNPLPWPLLGGRTAHGMALLVELKGRKARYQVLHGKSRRRRLRR